MNWRMLPGMLARVSARDEKCPRPRSDAPDRGSPRRRPRISIQQIPQHKNIREQQGVFLARSCQREQNLCVLRRFRLQGWARTPLRDINWRPECDNSSKTSNKMNT